MDPLERDPSVWPPPISTDESSLPTTPLYAPEIHLIDVNASPTEQLWKNIPLVGWALEDYMWRKRTHFIVDTVQNQLRLRQVVPESVWGDSGERRFLVKWLSGKIASNMGWCTDHYIPQDPIYVLLWAHEDGLDVEDLIGQIEDHLKLKLSDEEVRGWFNLTLGEVVDILLAKKGIVGR